jgi:hypothetical protein
MTDYGLRITDYGFLTADGSTDITDITDITDYGLRITDYGLRILKIENLVLFKIEN